MQLSFSCLFMLACGLLSGQLDLHGADFPVRQKVINKAVELLREMPVSYAFGGRQIGSAIECEQCNRCLASAQPDPKQRFAECPICKRCSLDCSHFIHWVFNQSGIKTPYLTTTMMRELAPDVIAKRFQWRSLGRQASRILPGDIVVFAGHVVLVTAVSANRTGYGDLIHATSGREVKGAGHGIQLQTNVRFEGFRGTIQRIFRHQTLDAELQRHLRKHQVRKM